MFWTKASQDVDCALYADNTSFVVAPNTVNPMDALDPEIACLVDARLVKLKRDLKE